MEEEEGEGEEDGWRRRGRKSERMGRGGVGKVLGECTHMHNVTIVV